MIHGFDTSFLVAAEVAEHPDHEGVWRRIRESKAQGDGFALTAAVLAEFVHIVTDVRRFKLPMTVPQALSEARGWLEASDVEHIVPDDEAVKWFLEAMSRYQLGRKRVLDTLLAATYRGAGITSLLTLNAADFATFGEFTCLGVIAEKGS